MFASQCTLYCKASHRGGHARSGQGVGRHHRDPKSDGARRRVPRLRPDDGGRDRRAGGHRRPAPESLVARTGGQQLGISRAVGRDGRDLGGADRHRDGCPHPADSFRAGRRDDPCRNRAVHPRGRRGSAAHFRSLPVRAAEPLDAAGPMADRVQPRPVRLLPFAPARDVRCRRLVSGRRPRQSCASPAATMRSRRMPWRYPTGSDRV